MPAATVSAEEALWKVGIAKKVITPKKPLWLAGYSGRDRPAEGKLHDLWVKMLALEDPKGNRGLMVTSDHIGWSKTLYDSICAKLEKQYKLTRSQIILTASHTHSGPVLRDSLLDYYPLDAERMALIEAYSTELEAKVVSAAGEAFSKLAPARLFAGAGVTRFAVNRRNNPEPDVPTMLESNARLKGPVDHSVPVLAVRSPEGKLQALLFGYACHTTTLSSYVWCGDYGGFAQVALEQSHPEVTALFWMGCGADINPLPRRSVVLCERYGRMLAAAVEEVLLEPMKEISPGLCTTFEEVSLDFEKTSTREELGKHLKGKSALRRRWAKRMLEKLEKNKGFEKSYPYPIQAWGLGKDHLWIGLAGEAVVDYALRFKKEFGPNTWVIGFASDLMAYIPSRRVWEEGGYEGGALYEYGLPAERWTGDVEDRVAGCVHRLVGKVRP